MLIVGGRQKKTNLSVHSRSSVKLYTYYRSSASYRVRIALNLKALAFESVPINLVTGEQREESFLEISPLGRIPVFEDGSRRISQSTAILEYLEETYPTPALLPKNTEDRAFARQVASLVACDIHPLNNLSSLTYLKRNFGANEGQIQEWYGHWISIGFNAIENYLAARKTTSSFVLGEKPGWIELHLVPQVYNARRFQVPVGSYPIIIRLVSQCEELPEFAAAAPQQQLDSRR